MTPEMDEEMDRMTAEDIFRLANEIVRAQGRKKR